MRTVMLFGKYETLIMNGQELKEFMKDKKVWHSQVNWWELWDIEKNSHGRWDYAPYNGVIMHESIELSPYRSGYGPRCHSSSVVGGGTLWDQERWVINQNDRNKLFYLRHRKGRKTP
jgi:hypothetical protein